MKAIEELREKLRKNSFCSNDNEIHLDGRIHWISVGRAVELAEEIINQQNGSINELLKEYFAKKDELKKTKQLRVEFHQNVQDKCDLHNQTEDDFGQMRNIDCIVALQLNEKKVTLCRYCQTRHEFHTKIKKLSHRCSGIMKSLRSKLKTDEE